MVQYSSINSVFTKFNTSTFKQTIIIYIITMRPGEGVVSPYAHCMLYSLTVRSVALENFEE